MTERSPTLLELRRQGEVYVEAIRKHMLLNRTPYGDFIVLYVRKAIESIDFCLKEMARARRTNAR